MEARQGKKGQDNTKYDNKVSGVSGAAQLSGAAVAARNVNLDAVLFSFHARFGIPESHSPRPKHALCLITTLTPRNTPAGTAPGLASTRQPKLA